MPNEKRDPNDLFECHNDERRKQEPNLRQMRSFLESRACSHEFRGANRICSIVQGFLEFK
jgi:hypothetical protein